MMRKILTAAIIMLLSGAGAAANTVALGPGAGTPGSEVELHVAMSGADPVCAMELQLPLGGAMRFIGGSAALTSRTQGFAVQAAEVDDVLKIYLYHPSLGTVRGSDGDVLTFRVRLAETSGTFSLLPKVILSDASGARSECTAEAGDVTVHAPRLELRTTSIDFGRVPIRGTYRRTVEIANTGNEPMHVAGFESTAPEVTAVSPAQATLGAGESARFELTFAPVEHGTHSSALKVMTDAVNAKTYARWPEVAVKAEPYSVNELHLDRAEGRADSEVTLRLRMNNMEPIVAMQTQLTLPEGITYVEGSARAGSRANGHTLQASCTGQNLSLIAYSGANRPFSGDDGEILTFKVRLGAPNGRYSLTPQHTVLANREGENMVSAVTGNHVVISSPTFNGAAALAFGDMPVTAPVEKGYSIYNSGPEPLVIDRAIFLAEGYNVAEPLPLTVEPYKTRTLTVRRDAPGYGAFATTLNLYTNDPKTRMKAVAVSGSVYSPNALGAADDFDAARGYLMDVSLENHAEVSGIQFDARVADPSLVEGEPRLTLAARSAGFVSACRQVSEAVYRVVLYTIGNQPLAGNSGKVLTVAFPTATDATAPLQVEISGIVISTTGGENVTTPGNAVSLCITPYLAGDANLDGTISIFDATAINNYLLMQSGNAGLHKAADLNKDGQVTIQDMTGIINTILSGQ